MPALIFHRERGPGDVPNDDLRESYLHLRFANIKASPSAYWWAYPEVIALDKYRCDQRWPAIRSEKALSPFEDAVKFPIPHYGRKIRTGMSKSGDGTPSLPGSLDGIGRLNLR
jgi:hypothetical protein